MPSKHKAGGCNCCECVCSYSHGFVYEPSSCTLTFTLTNNCGDIVEADIDVVITGPDGIDETEPVISGNTYTWTLYKPTLGDWTAAISITCPGELLEYFDEITVDDVYDCLCCETSRPDFAVVSGFGGCCAPANGTYVFDVAPSSTCSWGKTIITYSAPSVPCNNECFTWTRVSILGTTVYYFYYYSAAVFVFLDELGPDIPQVIVNVVWVAYERLNGGACTLTSWRGSTQWHYRMNCESGTATLTPSTGSFDNGELITQFGASGVFVPCDPPTVVLEFA